MITEIPTYPVQLAVDYPDRELNRLTTFFRPLVAVPILVIAAAVSGATVRSGQASGTAEVLGGGLLVLPTLLMILWPCWRLAKKGARLVLPPESFIATGMKGPPAEGERARAGTWAATVQARARETAARPSRLRGAVVVIGPSLALVFLSAASVTAAAFGWLALPGRSKVARLLRLLSAPGAVWTVAYPLVIRPWHLHWVATAEEVRRALPGDEVVPQPGWQSTRAITIHAPARAIWRWLVQLGQGRGGFYTYDWLENLAGLDIHSAERTVPELQRLKVGDFVRSAPESAGPAFGWTVARIEPARALVLGVGRPGAGGGYPGVWTFVLDAIDDRITRLIVRGRTVNKPALVAGTMFIELQWFIMERGMLQGIKRRAERAP